MKKQTKIILITVLILIIAMPLFYKLIGSTNMKSKTSEYLESKGCTQNDIISINVKHSFMNKILSYNEWLILVTFTNEPNVIYDFTYRNNEIVFTGVSDSQSSKEDIKYLEDKFNNGELWN